MADVGDECEPLPHQPLLYLRSGGADDDHAERAATIPRAYGVATGLYVSHALTTWQARSYEFAAVLFTAAAFPDTLLWSSVRGIVTTLAALLFSSALGNAIDRTSSRLTPLMASISANRVSVILACIAWLLLLGREEGSQKAMTADRVVPFILVLLLGVCEKLSGIANMLSSERDWAPTLAEDIRDLSLTKLNSVLRRIDLTCKLVAPLFISGVSAYFTITTAVWVLGSLSALTWSIEILTARYVWRSSEALQKERVGAQQEDTRSWMSRAVDAPLSTVAQSLTEQSSRIRAYFSSSVCVPSLALSLLHFSALSYSATLITYLLNVGFSITTITIARTLGSIIEVSSTYIAPVGIRTLTVSGNALLADVAEYHGNSSPRSMTADVSHGTGLARCGLWGLMLQLFSLIPVVAAVWGINLARDGMVTPLTPDANMVTAIPLFAFLSISRLGLWVFDLTTQEFTQSRVAAEERSAFAGTETAFVSLFELAQWVAAAVLSDPSQFQYLATASLGGVLASTIMYTAWVRHQRGHLMHWRRVAEACKCDKICEHSS